MIITIRIVILAAPIYWTLCVYQALCQAPSVCYLSFTGILSPLYTWENWDFRIRLAPGLSILFSAPGFQLHLMTPIEVWYNLPSWPPEPLSLSPNRDTSMSRARRLQLSQLFNINPHHLRWLVGQESWEWGAQVENQIQVTVPRVCCAPFFPMNCPYRRQQNWWKWCLPEPGRAGS